MYPTASTRETWIGVPERGSVGTANRFVLSTDAAGPNREADLIMYEKMLGSMRLDPHELDKQR